MTSPRQNKINGYEWYIAHDNGMIWSEKSKKFLSTRTKSKGYVKVNLYDDEGKVKNVRVHRIIWEAFNGAIPDGYEINHKNGIRDDNRLENLELLTHRDNLLYGDGLEKRRLAQIQKVKRGGLSNFATPIMVTDDANSVKTFYPSKIEFALAIGVKKKHLIYKLSKMRNRGLNTVWLNGREYKIEELQLKLNKCYEECH